MAKQTLEQARDKGVLDPVRAEALLQHKSREIRAVNRIADDRGTCFRALLLAMLVPYREREKRPMSQRVLVWVFGTQTRKSKAAFCCDACDPKKTRAFIGMSLG
jgi:hypothetical protein